MGLTHGREELTELTLIEKLRLAHATTGQKMLSEAADRIEELEAALQAICGTSFCARNDMDLNFVSRSAVDAARKLLGEKI